MSGGNDPLDVWDHPLLNGKRFSVLGLSWLVTTIFAVEFVIYACLGLLPLWPALLTGWPWYGLSWQTLDFLMGPVGSLMADARTRAYLYLCLFATIIIASLDALAATQLVWLVVDYELGLLTAAQVAASLPSGVIPALAAAGLTVLILVCHVRILIDYISTLSLARTLKRRMLARPQARPMGARRRMDQHGSSGQS